MENLNTIHNSIFLIKYVNHVVLNLFVVKETKRVNYKASVS